MTVETAAGFAALVFIVFAMPSGRMLEFADWRFQKSLKACLALGIAIFTVRAVFFCAALAAAMAFVRAMPDGLALARGAALVFLALTVVRQLLRLRRPLAVGLNDNLPGKTFLARLLHGLRGHLRPSFELTLSAAMVIFFVSPAIVNLDDAARLAAAFAFGSLLALLFYAAFARVVLVRYDRRSQGLRRARVARLLSSGLPSVSARFRKDAA